MMAFPKRFHRTERSRIVEKEDRELRMEYLDCQVKVFIVGLKKLFANSFGTNMQGMGMGIRDDLPFFLQLFFSLLFGSPHTGT